SSPSSACRAFTSGTSTCAWILACSMTETVTGGLALCFSDYSASGGRGQADCEDRADRPPGPRCETGLLRAARVATHALGRMRLWRIGVGIGRIAGLRRIAGLLLAKPGIAEAVAADAGGRRLALLHGVIAAAGHVAGDVLPAKFAGGGATG